MRLIVNAALAALIALSAFAVKSGALSGSATTAFASDPSVSMVNCWAVTTLPKTKYCQASAVVTGTYTANTDKDFIVKVLAAPNGKITSVSVNGGSPIPVSGTTPFKIGAGLSMAFDTGTPNIVGQSYGFEASPDSDCKNKPSVNC